MAIIIEKEKKLITLHTRNTTYQMMIGKLGHLLHLYYGKRLEGDMSYLLTYYDRGFSGNPYDAEADRTYSMDALPQEYACYGNGDFRSTALRIKNGDGTYSVDLRYVSCEIKKGKYRLPQLPATYVESEEEAETLEVILEDCHSGCQVTLYYGVLEELDVITRAARIENKGGQTFYIEKAASVCLDFMEGQYDFIHFHGRHGMERLFERCSLAHNDQTIGSIRGTSSHQHNPFFMVAEPSATEEHGNCYGFSLLYSGNFKGEAALDQYEQTRILLGLSDEMFSYELRSGEAFYTPEVALSFSGNGMTTLSQNYHQLIRKHICRGNYKEKRRPILINNWEATYFDFTGEKLIQIAKQAAELGVEMLVLDDGWFGKRDDDFSGLGDWFVNEEKMGGKLIETVSQIREMGMKFGIWIEPEMVSEDSELYRKHPDWAFTIPGRKPVRARHQLVLDFSRREVVDGILEQLFKVLDEVRPDYVKMDMNRHLTDIYSLGAAYQNQGMIMHKYVLGVYDFLERLQARYPEMLIEGCSGGGGRFDAGMLYYTPQIWCSDNTDAIERTKIQYGTSFGYPISTVGSHVSAVPNHQTGRTTPIETRAVVAMSGSFGYELDLNLITPEEKEAVKVQIERFKKDWPLIHNGRYYRLNSPFKQHYFTAWGYVSEEKDKALVSVVTLDTQCNPATYYVKLKGLDLETSYKVEETGSIYSGAALMYAGLPIPRMKDEYESWQVHLTQV